MTPTNIVDAALNAGWAMVPGRVIDGILFRRGIAELVVYSEPAGLTVVTTLTHPVVGRSTFTRKRLTPEDFRAVLDNPRVHLNKGGKYEDVGGRKALKSREERRRQAEARAAEAAQDFAPAHVMTEFCWCWPKVDGPVVLHNTR